MLLYANRIIMCQQINYSQMTVNLYTNCLFHLSNYDEQLAKLIEIFQKQEIIMFEIIRYHRNYSSVSLYKHSMPFQFSNDG